MIQKKSLQDALKNPETVAVLEGLLPPIFVNRSSITGVTDFNEIKEPGIYSTFAPPLNAPSDYNINHPGMLIVITASPNDTGRLVHNLIIPDLGKQYIRTYSSVDDRWFEWKEI